MGGIQSLIAFVIGNGIQHFGIRPTVVITVYDFPHQPEVRIFLFAERLQPAEKFRADTVGGIQTQSVNMKFIHPHGNTVQQIANDLFILQIELYQIVVPFPCIIGKIIMQRTACMKVQIGKPAAIP